MPSALPLLELNGATVYRGDTRVFSDISLTIPAGQNTVVLGPNGSGKTTLLKLLSRELHALHREPPSVRVFGEGDWDVFELRRQLGVVSQDLQLTYQRPVSALEVVASGFFASIGVHAHQTVSRAMLERCEQSLDAMGVLALRDQPFTQLSTGQQRRCLLARALVHDPQTLVLDEPTTGLDLRATFGLLNLLRALVRSGKTLVLVTHHLHEVLPEISHAILLESGRVFATGPKESVLTESALSQLFGVPLALMHRDGYVHAIPAHDRPNA